MKIIKRFNDFLDNYCMEVIIWVGGVGAMFAIAALFFGSRG